MSDERLRDLLHRAVPELPDLDPGQIKERAQAERRTRNAAWSGAAAVIAVAAVAAASLLAGSGDTGEPGRDDGATSPSPSRSDLSPYDPEPCPANLPSSPSDSAELNGVVAVRLCSDLDPRDHPGWQPSAEQVAQLANADALVHGLDEFTAGIRGLPSGLPTYCTTDRGPYLQEALALDRADGTRALVAVTGCEVVTLEGGPVDPAAVRQLYLRLLDRQRDELTYTLPFDDELTCTSQESGGPVRPGRERLVAAVACTLPPGAESIPPDLAGTRLDGPQLVELNRAWSKPRPPVVRGPSGEHECLDLPEPPPFLVAATDRGDVVQLIDSPCGFLVWHGWEHHRGATLPTTVAEFR